MVLSYSLVLAATFCAVIAESVIMSYFQSERSIVLSGDDLWCEIGGHRAELPTACRMQNQEFNVLFKLWWVQPSRLASLCGTGGGVILS